MFVRATDQQKPDGNEPSYADKHDKITEYIQRIWQAMPKGHDGKQDITQYTEMNLRLQKILTPPPWNLKNAMRIAEQDWILDAQGQTHLDFSKFVESMFQLLNAWAEPRTQKEYVAILDRILLVCFLLELSNRA